MYVGIIIISCIFLSYLHCSDFIYLCWTSIILVLLIIVISFYVCVYINMYTCLLIIYLCILFYLLSQRSAKGKARLLARWHPALSHTGIYVCFACVTVFCLQVWILSSCHNGKDNSLWIVTPCLMGQVCLWECHSKDDIPLGVPPCPIIRGAGLSRFVRV